MSEVIPASHLDLLTTKAAFASLATTTKDGWPQVTPVWIGWDGKHVFVNTARGRVKDKTLKSRRPVAMAVLDPDNPYRYLGLRGRVIDETEAGADASIDALAKKYMGVDSYPYRKPTEVRVVYTIEIVSAHAMG